MTPRELRRYERARARITAIPVREWPWWKRALERAYRATHRGQAYWLVVRPWEGP